VPLAPPPPAPTPTQQSGKQPLPNTAPISPPGTQGTVPLTTQSGQRTFLNQANQLAANYWNALGMSPSNPTGNLSNAPGIQGVTAPALSPGSYATSGYMQNASVSNPAPASNQPMQPSGPMNPFSGKSPSGGGGSNTLTQTGPNTYTGGTWSGIPNGGYGDMSVFARQYANQFGGPTSTAGGPPIAVPMAQSPVQPVMGGK